MPIVNKPDMNYGVWAENGNIEIPSSEKVEEGWVVEKPLNEQANWVENRQDKMLQYINQRGIPEWDLRTEYPVDAYVAYLGSVFKAVSQNIDQDPSLNTEIWKTAFATYQDFVDFSETITSIKEEEGYLNLYVSKANPVLDAKSKGVAYGNSTGVSDFGFVGDKPNVSVNGSVIAEFGNDGSAKEVITREMLALEVQSYKVDDIYITTGLGDPRVRLGYGTWVRYGEGRTLVGFSTSTSNDVPEWTKVEGRTFGDYDHKLTVNEMPSHKHGYIAGHEDGVSSTRVDNVGHIAVNGQGSTYVTHTSSATDGSEMNMTGGNSMLSEGRDQPHNNVQPSITVYFWLRVS